MLLKDLLRVRRDQGIAVEITRRSGLSPSALSRLESGVNANPTYDTLVRYARAIGVEIRLTIDEPSMDGQGPLRGNLTEDEQVVLAMVRVLGLDESIRRLVMAMPLATPSRRGISPVVLRPAEPSEVQTPVAKPSKKRRNVEFNNSSPQSAQHT